MKRIKKKAITIGIVIIIIIGCLFLFNKKKVAYDINMPINEYNLSSDFSKNQYKDFIKESLKPEKLRKYVINDRIVLNTSLTGQGVLDDMRHEAYNQFFYQLFNENVKYDEAPVTDNFISEFKEGIKKKFNIEAEEIYTTVDTVDKYITVECRNEFDSQGEAQRIDIYKFSYKLDDNGNVENIVLESKENIV